MDLLEEINKKIPTLLHTKTRIMSPLGHIYEEDLVEGTREFKYKGLGFALDMTPDFKADKILPGLLLGSQFVTLFRSKLENYNIDHILSIGSPVIPHPGFEYTFIEATDSPDFNIVETFETCFKIINSVRSEGKTVFVHCYVGASRSASVVIGYLMKECSMNYQKAYDFVKNIRPVIQPNEGFVKQLLTYEEQLKKNANS